MKKERTTEIICLVDKSDSMYAMVDEAIAGFNNFLIAQKKIAGKANMTLVLFDTGYECLENGVDMDKVKPLHRDIYVPSRMTSLFDAIGQAIVDLEFRLKHLSGNELPRNIVFAILTDGEDTSSYLYSRELVFEIIREKTQVNHWKFIFLAAHQDGIIAAESIGIERSMAYEFPTNEAGIRGCFAVTNELISNYRQHGRFKCL